MDTKEKRVQFGAVLPEKMLEQIKALAKKEERSISQTVKRLLEKALKDTE